LWKREDEIPKMFLPKLGNSNTSIGRKGWEGCDWFDLKMDYCEASEG